MLVARFQEGCDGRTRVISPEWVAVLLCGGRQPNGQEKKHYDAEKKADLKSHESRA
jgi:hypothetical protein